MCDKPCAGMDCKVKLVCGIAGVLVLLSLSFVITQPIFLFMEHCPNGCSPEYIEYYDYPYGENGSLVSLPVLMCYPWYDLKAAEYSNYGGSDWARGDNGTYCLKLYH